MFRLLVMKRDGHKKPLLTQIAKESHIPYAKTYLVWEEDLLTQIERLNIYE